MTINKRTMLIHSLLLTLQSLVAVVSALIPFFQVFLYHASLINIVETAVDLVVQLMICYICLTMGSHEQLCKFQLTLDLTTGEPKVVFKRRRGTVIDTEI